MTVLCNVVIDRTNVVVVTVDLQAEWSFLVDFLKVQRVALKNED